MFEDSLNSRVLVIDDEEVVRDSIRLILTPKRTNSREIQSLAADLFEDAPPAPKPPYGIVEFTVDEAPNGRTGLEMIKTALEIEKPYAVAFVDMRMPGWDGLETVLQIRSIDRQVEICFLTAFSDKTIDEVITQAGPSVGYHRKPFEPEEIKQIATRSVHSWNKMRQMERLVDAHRNSRKRIMNTKLTGSLSSAK